MAAMEVLLLSLAASVAKTEQRGRDENQCHEAEYTATSGMQYLEMLGIEKWWKALGSLEKEASETEDCVEVDFSLTLRFLAEKPTISTKD